MTKRELQIIVDASKDKRQIEKRLKILGYHNTRFYRPTKGADLQKIAQACEEECEEKERENCWLFASVGVYLGYEYIWLEQTKKSPRRYSVSIFAKKL